MREKRLYISTIGCQMNVYDSQQIENILIPLGYTKTEMIDRADMIILNTCAIREKAQEKAFSFLGRLATLKTKNPDLIIGIGGCVAQQEGKRIVRRVPFADIVFGTHAIGRLPQMVRKIEKERQRIIDVAMGTSIDEFEFQYTSQSDISRFVTIMRGCDNFCTYCVVPYVRGREISRNPQKILTEIQDLVNSGVKEVTLLGQNVNSYGKKEHLPRFHTLLAKVNEIDGLDRIRFTTSHPKDLSDDLIDAFTYLDKLCHHIHLPVQSGSNRILTRMNRKYTRESYLEKLAKLRQACPDIAITSDMIVGFPGETQDDYQDTLSLMKTVEFDGLFAFMYSDRPNAKAAGFDDKVPDDEKNARLLNLLELQEHYTRQKNQMLVGTHQTILVEGMSKKQEHRNGDISPAAIQWTGRTSGNKIVHFLSEKSEGKDCTFPTEPCITNINIGNLVTIKITKAFSHSLFGEPIKVNQPLTLI